MLISFIHVDVLNIWKTEYIIYIYFTLFADCYEKDQAVFQDPINSNSQTFFATVFVSLLLRLTG